MQFRCDDEMRKKIDLASNLTGVSKADIMRLAMQIGLSDIERIQHDIPRAIMNEAKRMSVSYFDAKKIRTDQVADG